MRVRQTHSTKFHFQYIDSSFFIGKSLPFRGRFRWESPGLRMAMRAWRPRGQRDLTVTPRRSRNRHQMEARRGGALAWQVPESKRKAGRAFASRSGAADRLAGVICTALQLAIVGIAANLQITQLSEL